MRDKQVFIPLEVQLVRLSVTDDDSGYFSPILEDACVIEKVIKDLLWGSWLPCKIKNMSLLELLNQNIVKDYQSAFLILAGLEGNMRCHNILKVS